MSERRLTGPDPRFANGWRVPNSWPEGVRTVRCLGCSGPFSSPSKSCRICPSCRVKDRSGAPKLSEQQALALRKLAATGTPVGLLALRFDLSETQVRRIVKGKNWRPAEAGA